MKSGRTVEHALADMLDAAEKACPFCGSLTVSEFAADDKSAFAVIHALAILGDGPCLPTPQRSAGLQPQMRWLLG